ncbi:unnamed protein product [Orchesella dallaii]|uniref:Uncharacterized protein n=1 Tax=Orchesella dallaii TaxID=48710 RepID=A0ABP1R7V9_9HEXA
MISPCGGCDPHLAAAILCYFSFFLGSSSFFLYWYWLSSYRQEQKKEPLVKSETCHNTNCENCYCASTSTSCGAGDIAHRLGVDNPIMLGFESEGCPAILGDISDLEPLDDGGVGGGMDVTDSLASTSPLADNDDDILSRVVRTEEEDQEDEKPCPVSNNPYLPGNSMTHNVLWGLQGMLVNFVEAILAAIFYTGIFENNLVTTLTWCVGFSINFLLGNVMHTLLLVYCTNRKKLKELRIRWALELLFNTVKDLYFLWVGLALLDFNVKQSTK